MWNCPVTVLIVNPRTLQSKEENNSFLIITIISIDKPTPLLKQHSKSFHFHFFFLFFGTLRQKREMACSSLVKLNAASSSWIAGQQSVNPRIGSAAPFPTRRVSIIRAGSYTDELVKTAVSDFSVYTCLCCVWMNCLVHIIIWFINLYCCDIFQ